ncbi:MAG: 50S ribosomal protein L18e [Candidatus Micrarchaeota archaeon]
MKRGPESIATRRMVALLENAGRKNKAAVWLKVAERLQKPRRKMPEVNLFKLDKVANEGDVIVLPGKLLGIGVLTKKVTVAAFKASKEAKAKVSKSGGKLLTVADLVKQNPSGKGIRIIV